ncbi:hypothetical protein RCL1_008096 [Eukaryota sp. TZLM3-RCL]
MFKQHRQFISITTLHRILTASKISHKTCTEIMKEAIHELVQNFENYWNITAGIVHQNELVFIDEISFRSEHFKRTHGRSPKGQPIASIRTDFKEKQISCVVARAKNGVILSHIKEGHFDHTTFVQFLMDLIDSNCFFRHPGPRSIIVLDGCRIHFSPEIFEAMRKCGLLYIKLSPYSPEMNPIEAFFSLLRRRVRSSSEKYQIQLK